MNTWLRCALVSTALAVPFSANTAEPKLKTLATPADPTRETVLVGREMVSGMTIIFELEPAKGMWMYMGNKWVEHPVARGELYHVEVKPVDPKSKTRIPYAEVRFSAVNQTNKKTVAGTLHSMWGSSGLHYATNSALAGDGAYEATITIGVPTFGRAPQDRELWLKPVRAKFHFKLAAGKLVEVTEPAPEAK